MHESYRKRINYPDLGGPFRPIGHILSMNSRVHPEYKTKYRVRNWTEYDCALVQRGDITLWFSRTRQTLGRPDHRENEVAGGSSQIRQSKRHSCSGSSSNCRFGRRRVSFGQSYR